MQDGDYHDNDEEYYGVRALETELSTVHAVVVDEYRCNKRKFEGEAVEISDSTVKRSIYFRSPSSARQHKPVYFRGQEGNQEPHMRLPCLEMPPLRRT